MTLSGGCAGERLPNSCNEGGIIEAICAPFQSPKTDPKHPGCVVPLVETRVSGRRWFSNI